MLNAHATESERKLDEELAAEIEDMRKELKTEKKN